MRALEAAVRIALAGVLLYAGGQKIGDGWRFAEAIANYQLLPAQANQIAAVALPWIEVLCGLLLLLALWVRPAALATAGLFAVLTVAVLAALARGLDIDCGCFGSGAAARVGLKTLAIDLACLFAAGFVAWRAGGEEGRRQELGARS